MREPNGAIRWNIVLTSLIASTATPAAAQVDQDVAASYFAEAQRLCEADGGRLWGVSLCGPMVIADAATGTIATSRPAPDAERPRALGYANAAMDWGGVRWATYVWALIPDNERSRTQIFLHELFHRAQFDLGLITEQGRNDHLDTPEGRYWMQLEWRALARALGAEGDDRTSAVRDALAFRKARRARFPDAFEHERREEIREGLAQYTGTVVAAPSWEDAVASALDQLARAPEQPTFVRTAAYTTGMVYGLLLDLWSPGWTRNIRGDDDLGRLLVDAADLGPSDNAAAIAARYGAAELRMAEEKREVARQVRIAELRARFVEGPVVVLPRGRGASFITTGSTPIPGHGATLAAYRVTGAWGSLEAETVLVSEDGETLTLPGPPSIDGTALTGPGWTATLAPGWTLGAGPRPGDVQVQRGG